MTDKIKDIKETKEMLVDALKGRLAQGVEAVDAQEAGEVTDMIKDLAEAEKECWEAAYYKSIVEAMKKADEPERMGYDNWRYSDGRFAPTGRGTRDGYTPVNHDWMGYTTTDGDRTPYDGSMRTRMGYTDPVEELGVIWRDSDPDQRHRLKSALEEMTRSLG